MQASDAARVIDVDRETLKRGLADGSIVLVDVREPQEYAAGHIPGALSLPLSTFDPSQLPDGERVVLSCGSGVRSARALAIAQHEGRDIREHYKGGFKEWVGAGEPVE